MRRIFSALLLMLALVLPASAQETRGNIAGTVRDSTGVIPGATVTIVSMDTGSKQELTTNSSGYFEAPLMQPGTYEISVEIAGFKRLTQRGVVLAVAQQINIPFVMEVGAISETITVTGEAPLLDTSSVSSAQTFDTRMVESLPMLSNMPIMLTRFAAGVNPSASQSLVSQGFVDGTTTAAGESFGGVGSNTYSIDGAANNSTNRRIATSPNSDMVEEMRVESSNFDASIGHGTGLQISMTTKAGANQYRGTGSYQYLDEQDQQPQSEPEGDLHGIRQGSLRRGPLAQYGVHAGRSDPAEQDVLLRQLFLRQRLHSRKEPGHEHGSGERSASARRLLGPAAAAEPRAVPDLRSLHGEAGSRAPGAIHPHAVRQQHHPGEPHRQPAVRPLQADGAEAESEFRGERNQSAQQLLSRRRARHPEELPGGRPRRLQHRQQRPHLRSRFEEHVHRGRRRLDV